MYASIHHAVHGTQHDISFEVKIQSGCHPERSRRMVRVKTWILVVTRDEIERDGFIILFVLTQKESKSSRLPGGSLKCYAQDFLPKSKPFPALNFGISHAIETPELDFDAHLRKALFLCQGKLNGHFERVEGWCDKSLACRSIRNEIGC
ncbi:MAG TPA: hypothetical protein DCG19_04565 [Cryomorphaceae bacterium]|nr:hypothetical protein [Owenweeksia sp.]MBG00101.1 hypothetical protein [Owenweeksia sp.]HAD96655.1 hypothetical protein [Cryomorphaceae bacterium]HBF21956.1 hypothetical protein [Cryomorphaceae bacterium]|tara:strand:+ start:242 stop:688 length:447 start_codon:yes stop_codon:yes gene_type:complete